MGTFLLLVLLTMDVVFEYADVGGAWLVENAPGVGEAIRMYEHLPGAMERASEGMANLVSEGWGAVPTKAMEGLVVDVSKAVLDQDTLTALGWTYARIMAAVSLLCILFHLPMVLYKLKLYGQGMLHLLFSTDKKFKPYSTHVPESEESFTPYREIIFVRHGESTWNDTFNRSKNPIYFIPRLVKAWAYETWLFLSGREDSWFYDSPLSDHGTGQAESLAQFLDEFTPGASSPAQVKYVNVLKGTSTPAVHVVSNLRRAISTNAIGLRGRLAATGEKMLILPALQEISRNIDTLSLTPPGEHPAPSWIDERNPNVNIPAILENHIDPSLHTGNKAVRSSFAIGRLNKRPSTLWSEATRSGSVPFSTPSSRPPHPLWAKRPSSTTQTASDSPCCG